MEHTDTYSGTFSVPVNEGLIFSSGDWTVWENEDGSVEVKCGDKIVRYYE